MRELTTKGYKAQIGLLTSTEQYEKKSQNGPDVEVLNNSIYIQHNLVFSKWCLPNCQLAKAVCDG